MQLVGKLYVCMERLLAVIPLNLCGILLFLGLFFGFVTFLVPLRKDLV